MKAYEALESIRTVIRDAADLEDHQVFFRRSPNSFVAGNFIRLDTLTFVEDTDTRFCDGEADGESAGTQSLSKMATFTIQVACESLDNAGSSSAHELAHETRLALEWPEAYPRTLALVDVPLNPTDIGRTVDGRWVSVWAFDVQFRAMIDKERTLTGDVIEHVNITGTLTDGVTDTNLDFTVSKP